ncbi:activator-dependent family glycosyltransferase [Natronosporangium hydrolyticum]|uniref:Activator-dependent family glycosyltransferase n=1 Tax=Natronosporangium hydrolyticum TaxID=2811111 RepID=A0A895YEM3_9ACTN|nr:activator-dependent family glycosyltransferase [Natronosporangium hydrolyticum]QSB16031.1 activator-dependent family glycosyltransferase [Natronosporangium hydrolyticum]
MRVLFTVYAAKTHFYNMVPLAWALRAAGHEVCVATPPELVAAVTNAGLPVVPAGDGPEPDPDHATGSDHVTSTGTWQSLTAGMTETRPEELTWDYVLGAFTVACSLHYEHMTGGRSMLDAVVEFAQRWRPDLVIWDAMTFAGPVAAQVCGAAHARFLFGLDYIARMYGDYHRLLEAQHPQRRDDPIGDWLAGRLDRFGAVYDPALQRELMTGQWTIDPTPEWMRLPLDLPYVALRYVPYNGMTVVPDWVRRRPERPRVCLTLGMTGRENLGGDLVSIGELLDAIASLDIELVATLTADQLGSYEAPDNVRVVDFVPLNEILPTCSAIIHHGGFGSLGNAMAHGVPHLIVPGRYWDEVDFGRLLDSRGAGLYLDPYRMAGDALKSKLSVEALREKLTELLADPGYLGNARQIRSELRSTPSPNDLVPVLEEFAAKHHGGASGAAGAARGRIPASPHVSEGPS